MLKRSVNRSALCSNSSKFAVSFLSSFGSDGRVKSTEIIYEEDFILRAFEPCCLSKCLHILRVSGVTRKSFELFFGLLLSFFINE